MIAETNILATSLWSSDLFSKELQSEFFKPYCSTESVGDLEFLSLDTEIERSKPNTERHFGSSCSQSSASSECSEDLYTDNANGHGDHDYFNPTFMNLLDDNIIITEPIGLYELSLGAEEDFDSCDNSQNTSNDGTSVTCISNSNNCSMPRRRKKCKLADPLSHVKSWSSMSHIEQIETVGNLSQIISNQMGLREQLDVIRIIDPTAAISSTDTEFIIDITALTDEKLQSVREYVRNVKGKCDMCSTSSGKNDNDESSVDSSSKIGKHKREVKGKRSQQKEQKAIKQRQKKEHRQLLKEKRSGLFLKEEVLSLSTNLHLEDDNMDIDILD